MTKVTPSAVSRFLAAGSSLAVSMLGAATTIAVLFAYTPDAANARSDRAVDASSRAVQPGGGMYDAPLVAGILR
jgi:hypothetical protein